MGGEAGTPLVTKQEDHLSWCRGEARGDWGMVLALPHPWRDRAQAPLVLLNVILLFLFSVVQSPAQSSLSEDVSIFPTPDGS